MLSCAKVGSTISGFSSTMNGKFVSSIVSRGIVSLKGHSLIGLLTYLRGGLVKSNFFFNVIGRGGGKVRSNFP